MNNFSVRARALAGKCSQDTSATGHCPVHGGCLIRMATGLSLKCTALQGMDRYVLHAFEMINFPVRGGAPAGRCSQDSSATGHCVERRKTNLC